jgi:hypothetical protein
VKSYLSGLSVAGLGLCGGGWLILAALAFPDEAGDAGRVNLATGAALVLVGCATAAAWAVAWRRRLRVDGVLRVPFPPVSRREARRNRRQLARDVRRAARLSRRAARAGRRAARQERGERGQAGVPPGAAAGGSGVHQPAPPAPPAPPEAPAPGYGGNDYGGGAGHDGASAADVLGELRALLGPLLTAAGANQVPAQLPWPQSLPLWPASPGPAEPWAPEQWLTEQWLTEQWPADVPPGAQWRPQRRPAGHAGECTPPSGPVPPWPAESHPAESHPAESHPAESHPAESHPAESHPAESRLPESRPAESRPAHPSHPRTRPEPDRPASDDELLRIADGEEAWW